jgi:hypothetical protein
VSLTVTESQAVFDLIHWLADAPKLLGAAGGPAPVSDERAAKALRLLADHAYRRLQVGIDQALIARGIARARQARCYGQAEAVCEAILRHVAAGADAIPWPSISRPFDEWHQAVVSQTPERRGARR